MRTHTLLLSTLLTLTLGSALHAQVPPVPDSPGAKNAARPRLTVPQLEIPLGDVIEGDIIDVTWKLENKGEGDLVIQRVQASCGCTVVDVPEDQRTIKPGASIDLKAQFNSAERPGEQHKHVVVYSNDPLEGELRVSFRANVKRLYELRPASGVVHLKSLQRGEASSRTLDVIAGAGQTALEIVSLTFPADAGITTKVEDFVDDQSKQPGKRISFIVKEGAPLDRLAADGMLKLKFGSIERERSVSVRGMVVGEVTVRPNLIDTTRTTSRRGQKFSPVMVSPASPGGDFKVLSVDGGSLLTAEFEPKEEGGRVVGFLVRAALREDAPIGPFGTSIAVRTNSSDQPLIEIPVFGTVLAPVIVSPGAVLFRAGDAASPRTRKVLLDASPAERLEIREVTSDSPALSTAFDSSAGSGPALASVEITLSGTLPSGVHYAKVQVTTNIEGGGRIEIPVTVVVP